MIDILIGSLITALEPGTAARLCGRVVSMGQGAGGVPTVWAVQQGGSRVLRVPMAEATPGCAGQPGAPPAAEIAGAPLPPAPRPASGAGSR